MTNEEVNKTIEIILNNQARFYANLQEIQEVQKESEKRINVLERATVNLYNAMIKTNETLDQLAAAQKETEKRFQETDGRMRETDERLNAVIFMAEKFFSGDNGISEN